MATPDRAPEDIEQATVVSIAVTHVRDDPQPDLRLDSRTAELCMQGARAEFERRVDDARRLYAEAWAAAMDDYDCFMAAHYIGHLAVDPADALRWHTVALDRARSVGVRSDRLLGSLYVNLGHAYERLGQPDEAARYFDLAASHGVTHRVE